MISMDAIILQNISKKYTLAQDRPILLKNLFVPQKKEEVWALKNVSLTIKKGETIGIIGENGSGKSTLLKVIAGITSPTEGAVKINGRVASLIELGAGFHQDLTGRENIYLNGILLGLTKKEIDRKYRDIVDFADIGKFIDQPIRTYSSGMNVRLGFSVAIHLDPDILLIDEVLAVGDEEFQYKSFQRIRQFHKLGKTILFVSHNLSQVRGQASQTLLLKEGKKVSFSLTPKAIDKYLRSFKIKPTNDDSIRKNTFQSKVLSKNYVIITKVVCLNGKNNTQKVFKPQSSLKVKITFLPKKRFTKLMFGIAIFKQGIYLFGTKKEIEIKESQTAVKQSLILDMRNHPFLKGIYTVSVGVCIDNQWSSPFDFKDNITSFEVQPSYKTLNYDGWIIAKHRWDLVADS